MINEDVPISYIIFNRPKHTRLTFEALRLSRPKRLFIIADGPRNNHPKDFALCNEVRSIVEHIDWPCEVSRNYSDTNLGLKRRVSSGLDWVFNQVERTIVLEDDCLPHPDFFVFCQLLLDRYAFDERIAVITGNNFQNNKLRGQASYYFSKYNHCWGWATWRRSWRKYDGNIKFWPDWKTSSTWRTINPDPIERAYWEDIFDKVHDGKYDSWAYPWTASTWFHGGLTVTPNVNLVSNIGFGPEGTHTLSNEDQPGLAVKAIGTISHPLSISIDMKADKYTFNYTFGGLHKRWNNRIKNYIFKYFRLLLKYFKFY